MNDAIRLLAARLRAGEVPALVGDSVSLDSDDIRLLLARLSAGETPPSYISVQKGISPNTFFKTLFPHHVRAPHLSVNQLHVLDQRRQWCRDRLGQSAIVCGADADWNVIDPGLREKVSWMIYDMRARWAAWGSSHYFADEHTAFEFKISWG